ncbi:MAG: ABC transporter permease [Rikenellaceae bacterium]|nr:ABC transporter permease [Rikenellaceae bacterium]
MAGNRLKIKWREYVSVLRTEYGHIFKDSGVILILIFAILIYATVYSLAYRNEVLRDIPVGVVDQSMTPASRQLIRTFDATPNVDVTYTPESMEEAEQLFYERKIYGVVYIPEEYERNLLRGIPAIVGVYVDASYFLMYRQVFSDVVSGLTGTGAEVGFSRLLANGINAPQAEALVDPVEFELKNLYNPYLGYGTFLMPAIIIVIIQQTLLIGIGMIGGTWREFGVYKKLIIPGEKRLSTLPIVLAKATAYMSIYAVTMVYILTLHYKMFHFPMNGAFGDIVSFLVPYVLACIFMGIAISTLFRYRENSILYMLWTSIPILLLSGASVPKEAMPHWLYTLGKIFPSSSGINGFVRIQTMGADLADVRPEVTTLWILCFVYLIVSCIGIRIVLNRSDVR